MPGTIHVSVLELVGLPSQLQPSSMGVKVSMGKQAHEMRNKEETSFTLTSLRDNLNVSIRDNEGNEVARTDVETRSIVEKVIWDDLFLLEGGGRIRMKLHFILTEDEQNRIRCMRESATRKKYEDLQKRRHSSAELRSASGGSPESLRDPLKSRHKNEGRSVDLSDFKANKISAESNVKRLNKAQPDQKKQAFPASKSAGSLQKLAAYQHVNERIQGQDMEQQNQVDKKPSSVRKAMLAFESSPVKDDSLATYKGRETNQLSSSTTVDIPPKAPILKKPVAVNTKTVLFKLEALHTPEVVGKEREKVLVDTNKIEKTSQISCNTTEDTPSNVSSLPKMITVNTKPVLSRLEKPSAPEELWNGRGELLPLNNKANEAARLRSNTRDDKPSKVPILKEKVDVSSKISPEKNVSKTQPTKEENKEKNSLKKLHIPFLPERSTFCLKKLLEALPKRRELPTDLSNGKSRITTFDPIVIEKKWRSKQWKPSQHRAKSRLFHENEHHAIDSWIFLDEMISPCVLSDDRPSVDFDEGCLSNSKRDNDQEKLTDTIVTQSKSKSTSKKGSIRTKKPESNSRQPNNTSFDGSAGQAVKIAIMVGFGFLVFLTRQKK